jgi:hypothetical protein
MSHVNFVAVLQPNYDSSEFSFPPVVLFAAYVAIESGHWFAEAKAGCVRTAVVTQAAAKDRFPPFASTDMNTPT